MNAIRLLLIVSLLVSVHAVRAQTPRKLDGLEYHGTGKAEHQEGCEGCGNVGMVRFLAGGRVDYLLPGSDIIDRKRYTRKGDGLTLEGGHMTMELKGDSLFIDAYGYRYPYIRMDGRGR